MYSLIVPVYGNAQTIDALLTALSGIDEALDGGLEVVFVIDASPDNAYTLLKEKLPDQSFCAILTCLSRNFGSFAAIRSGMESASGPYYAVMAADLQEPPELLIEIFESLSEEDYEVVVGTRAQRDDPILGRIASTLFWKFYRRFVQPEMPPGGIDIFGCKQNVRDLLLSMDESHSTLVGLLTWLGFRRKLVPYKRLPRNAGKSGWTFRKKLRYMMDSVYAFSDLPILVLLATGTFGLVTSLSLGSFILVLRLLDRIPVQGYTPLILTILFSTSLILIGLGTVAGYVWRTFENTKRRPSHVLMSQERFGKESKP
jgi:polyisoprenyl-phosphate glycosyltransferase